MAEGKYRITERLAAGGMAEVFKGYAESLQGFRKTVAIKRVLPALTKNKKFVAMFLDEARLALFLQHANIVQVFDVGHVDETYFIVMEFVDGVDLKQILEWRRRIGKRLPIGVTIYIAMEICKGLAYAHDVANPETGEPMGIVHRDISPPNVMFSRNGEVKVADFGLAKATSQIETTDPGVVKGKMSYLSPEAARGQEVDARADIFAVGILLYEMLTGKRLFYGDTDYQTVELVRAAKVPPIQAQNMDVEPELEELVRKSLSRRLEDRFQSAADLQDALAHYLFSRGLKVLQRDIAELVRACLEDLATQSSARRPRPNVIDNILQQELNAFTSVGFEGEPGGVHGAPAPAPAAAQDGGDLIDPRAWADDPDWLPRRTTGGRRATGAVPVQLTARAGNGVRAPAPGVTPGAPASDARDFAPRGHTPAGTAALPDPSGRRAAAASGPAAAAPTPVQAASDAGTAAILTPGPVGDPVAPPQAASGPAGPSGAHKGIVIAVVLAVVAVGLGLTAFLLKR